MSLPALEWIEPTAVAPSPEARQAAGSDLLACVLARRGVTSPADILALLNPAGQPAHSPSDLPDLDLGVERIARAMKLGQRIGVWGDFDVDGQTSTALLVGALRSLGADVCYYIPIREKESHGVHVPTLRAFLQQGVQLLLTCDTGVTAHAAVEFAAQHGVDTIITDHHGLPPALPPAAAVINPQRLPEAHPLRPLCGAGTAYKFIEALYAYLGRPGEEAQWQDLAALGTVADLALLTGENRPLVWRGLEQLRQNPRLAVQAMLENANIKETWLTEEHISFTLAPRLNALGRLSDANPAVEFLLSSSPSQTAVFAAQLEGYNLERRQLCDQVFAAAQNQIRQDPGLLRSPVLILHHPLWPGGVIGIVASRLVEQYQRPVLMLTGHPDGPLRGSARSVEGVHITQAIAETEPLLLGYGGHPMAAGLALPAEKLGAFRRELARAVRRQTAHQAPVGQLLIDADLPLTQINLDLVDNLERLAPFGPGNPPLTFVARGVKLRGEPVEIGHGQEHRRMQVFDPQTETLLEVLWWQSADLPYPQGEFDLAYRLRASTFQGQRRVQGEWVAYHDQEGAPIPVTQTAVTLTDWRAVHAWEDLPAPLPPDALIWAEGLTPRLPGSVDRLGWRPAPVLVIAALPPSRSDLNAALQAVQPQTVILLGIDPGLDEPQAFLTRLSGLVRAVLKRPEPTETLPRLAAAMAHPLHNVRLGLEWLAAAGHIRMQVSPENQAAFSPGGDPDPALAQRLEAALRAALQETAAFHAYYQQADPAALTAHASAQS